MGSWVAISKTAHAHKHWRPRAGYEFAASQQVVPVVMAELSKLLPHYVLGLIEAEEGKYQLVALVGTGGQRNLYVDNKSQWLCSYVPASVRAFPFALVRSTSGNNVFCIDDGSLCDDTTQPALFDSKGDLSEMATETLDFVSQCEHNREVTELACKALLDAGLITEWPISINRGEGMEPVTINGLHRVNEEALNSLDAVSFADLRSNGALQLAYAQLFSMAQVSQLTQRAEYLAKASANATAPSGLENLFSNDDSGTLNFDALETGHKDN